MSLLSLPGKACAKCLEKRREIFEPKLEDTQCGFHLGRSAIDQLSLFSKFSRNLGKRPKTFTYVLSLSRKHTTGLYVKSFGVLRECGVDGCLLVALEQGFPNWGTCTPSGTFAYLKGTFKVRNRRKKYVCMLFISNYLHIPVYQ